MLDLVHTPQNPVQETWQDLLQRNSAERPEEEEASPACEGSRTPTDSLARELEERDSLDQQQEQKWERSLNLN